MSQGDALAALAARVEELERELARRRDLDAIRAVLERYSRAVDWLDADLLASVFFDDAEIDYGFFRGGGRESRPLLMDLDRMAKRDGRWGIARRKHVAVAGNLIPGVGTDGLFAALSALVDASPAHPDYPRPPR